MLGVRARALLSKREGLHELGHPERIGRREDTKQMTRYFALDIPFRRFALNVLVVSIASLVPLLAIYVALTPGFAGLLAGGGQPLQRFLRQVVTNGVPVVFVVNYVAFFLFAWLNADKDFAPRPGLVLLIDLPVRLAAFVLLHVVIYMLSADWFGSFGGSRATALRVVAPTLSRSAHFENISGVYLYATLVSALPLYVSAIERSPLLHRVSDPLPARPIAVLLALLLFAAFVVALTIAVSVLAQLPSFR